MTSDRTTYYLSEPGKGEVRAPNLQRVVGVMTVEEIKDELANVERLWPDEPDVRALYEKALRDELATRKRDGELGG